MATNNFPYIISDLDGTIVKQGFDIEDKTIQDIVNYQNKTGGKFTFSTGRSDEMTKSIVDRLHVTMPVISCNGALIRDPKTKEVLYTNCVDNEIAYNCIMKAKELNLDICAYDENSIIVTNKSQRYIVWNEINQTIPEQEYKVRFTFFDNLEDMANAAKAGKLNILKLLIDCSIDHRDADAVKVFDDYKDTLNYTWSGNNLLDAMNQGVSKKSGLQEFAKLMNIEPTDIVAIGDNYNDISMIEYVKHGVAVGNAVDTLKKVAYYVSTPIDENAVGNVLDKILNGSF